MEIELATSSAVTFLLVSTRMVATLMVAPPFAGGMVPVRIRLALSVAIGLLVASGPPAEAILPVPLNAADLIMAVAGQVLVGLAFGFMIQLLLAAFQVAGSVIDMSVGFSAGALYDPMTMSSVAPVGRLFQMVSMVILVVLNGHLLIVRGVLRSFEVAPLGGLAIENVGPFFTRGLAHLFVAALEIGFPILAALTLAEVALGIATRAAPRMNILTIGFGVKSMVLILVLGMGLPLMVNATVNLLDRGLRWGAALLGG